MAVLMEQAFTFITGNSEGDYRMRCNPDFKREMKAKQKALE